MFKKICICFFIVSTWIASSAYAGSEDWTGTFKFRDINNQEYPVYHSPQYFQFLFFRIGNQLHLGKGCSLNGLIIPEEVNLRTSQSVEEFSKELTKFGTILDQTIVLGPTYSAS